MKKNDKAKQEQKSLGWVSKQPKAVMELTGQDLQHVQGGMMSQTGERGKKGGSTDNSSTPK